MSGACLGKLVFDDKDVDFEDPNKVGQQTLVLRNQQLNLRVCSAIWWRKSAERSRRLSAVALSKCIVAVSRTVCVHAVAHAQILAVDCGIKNNIIRYLVSKGIEVKVVPW